jgi:hypothetical protein
MKPEILEALHALIHERLFGSRPWLADGELVYAVANRLEAFGLYEPIPEDRDGKRSTALGRLVRIQLMEAFMGVWDEWETPEILEMHGLISEEEMLAAKKRLGREDPEAVLLPMVRRAFFRHFQAGARLH